MRLSNPNKQKQARHLRRKARIRARVAGTAERPRLAVFRSLAHISAQLIDDATGRTLAMAGDADLAKKVTAAEGLAGKAAKAYAVGMLLAERAKKAGVGVVVFDRGGHRYHGRIKALADGARAGGLTF